MVSALQIAKDLQERGPPWRHVARVPNIALQGWRPWCANHWDCSGNGWAASETCRCSNKEPRRPNLGRLHKATGLELFGGKRLDSRSRTLSFTESHIFLPNQCHGDPFNEMKKTYSLHQIKLVVNKTYDFQKKPTFGMPQKKRSRRNASLFQP